MDKQELQGSTALYDVSSLCLIQRNVLLLPLDGDTDHTIHPRPSLATQCNSTNLAPVVPILGLDAPKFMIETKI